MMVDAVALWNQRDEGSNFVYETRCEEEVKAIKTVSQTNQEKRKEKINKVKMFEDYNRGCNGPHDLLKVTSQLIKLDFPMTVE